LKIKKHAPSVKAAIKAKRIPMPSIDASRTDPREPIPLPTRNRPPEVGEARKSQAQGDRAGVKVCRVSVRESALIVSRLQPLSSILNLPLLHMTPHDTGAIAKIWTAYHSAHPTQSSCFLSAHLPTTTYDSMLNLARTNPFFVLPLPRDAASNQSGTVKTDEYEMFYLQWLFHPTSSASSPPSPEATPSPLPLTSSIIFTPLEEFKKSGEWAQPYLVLTHYPELSHSHDLVLMRGEITVGTASGTAGSLANPGFLLSQPQAQLLALALQRFYCAEIPPRTESARDAEERGKRKDALQGFRERPGEWDWTGLVNMAYSGLV